MIAVVAGLIFREGHLLAAQRPEGGHLAGKWEFPGGKIERGESPEEALRRELREELGVEAEVGPVFHAIAHSYPEKDVLLLFYPCRLIRGEPRPIEEAQVRWASREALEDFDWAPADGPMIRRLTSPEADGLWADWAFQGDK